MNEMITPFGQLRPLQGGILARVANLKEVDHKLSKQASMHRATARVSAWCLNSSITQPGGKRCAYGARAARVAEHSNNT